jgi:hypothetical protein
MRTPISRSSACSVRKSPSIEQPDAFSCVVSTPMARKRESRQSRAAIERNAVRAPLGEILIDRGEQAVGGGALDELVAAKTQTRDESGSFSNGTIGMRKS